MNALAQYRASLSPEQIVEQRTKSLALAAASRIEREAFRASNKHLLKLSYLDSGHWHSLASKHSIRMPNSEDAVSSKIIRRFLKRCNVSVDLWDSHYSSVAYFVENNSKWTAFAAVGLILELKEQYNVGLTEGKV